jgi:transcriptional regulator with XRE-family HTH domain
MPLALADEPSDFFSFGELIETFRACDHMSTAEFAKVLGVEEAYLRDVEACDKTVSVKEAAAWASAIGYPATVFVQRVLQDQIDEAELGMSVWVETE